MWKTTIAALLTLALSSAGLHAKSGHNDNVDAAIGGMIAGVFLSEMIDSDASVSVEFASHHYDRGRYDSWNRYGRDSWKRYDRSYRYYDRRHDRRWDHRYDRGYYTYRTQKIWIPGYWAYDRDRHGRSVKIWVKGHHELRKIKVWIPARKGGYCRS